MDEVSETLEFLRFSYRPDAAYDGVVMFVLSGDQAEPHVRSVQIRDGVVTIVNGAHPAPSCVVRCAKDTFLGVYSGDLHPRTAILGGRLHVDGFNYNELRRFLTSFDFSSARWRQFYQERDLLQQQPRPSSIDAVLSSWRSMLIPTAHAHSVSKSLHLSRRVLTQDTILGAVEVATPTVAAPRMPPPPSTPLAFRGHRPSALIRALNTLARHPALVPAREHADFVYRLL